MPREHTAEQRVTERGTFERRDGGDWVKTGPGSGASPPRFSSGRSTVGVRFTREDVDNSINVYSRDIKDFENKWKPFIKDGKFQVKSRDPKVARRQTETFYKQYIAEFNKLQTRGKRINKQGQNIGYQESKLKALQERIAKREVRKKELQRQHPLATIDRIATPLVVKTDEWGRKMSGTDRSLAQLQRDSAAHTFATIDKAPYLTPFAKKTVKVFSHSSRQGIDPAMAFLSVPAPVGGGLKLFGISRKIKSPRVTTYEATKPKTRHGRTKTTVTPEGQVISFKLEKTIRTPFFDVPLATKTISKRLSAAKVSVFKGGSIYGKFVDKPIKQFKIVYDVKPKGLQTVARNRVSFPKTRQVTRRGRISGKVTSQDSANIFIAKTRGGRPTGRGYYQEIKSEKLGKVLDVNLKKQSAKKFDVYSVETKEAPAKALSTRADIERGIVTTGKLKPITIKFDSVTLKESFLKVPATKATKTGKDVGIIIKSGRKGGRGGQKLYSTTTSDLTLAKSTGQSIISGQISRTTASLEKLHIPKTKTTVTPKAITTQQEKGLQNISMDISQGQRSRTKSLLKKAVKEKGVQAFAPISSARFNIKSSADITSKAGLKSMQRSKLGQKAKLRQMQKQKTAFPHSPTQPMLKMPKVTPPKVTPPPIIPLFSLPKPTRKRSISTKKKPRKRKKAVFRPSLVGLQLPSVKLKAPSFFTGLETRRRR